MNELISKIANIPTNKTFGVLGYDRSYFVRRIASGFQVEAAWEVPEAHDDDADSCSYHPFKHNGRPRFGVCWIGRRLTVATAEDAAAAYDRFKQAMASNSMPTDGEVIGSVTR